MIVIDSTVLQLQGWGRVGWGLVGEGVGGIAPVAWMAPVPCPSGIFYFVIVSPMIML